MWDTAEPLRLLHHWKFTAGVCPRIIRTFLAEERMELGDQWFGQEWYCPLNDAVGADFSKNVIDAAFALDSDVKPLWEDLAA